MLAHMRSEELFSKAIEIIPGGVNSPVRAFRGVGGTPRFIKSAKGATPRVKVVLDTARHVLGVTASAFDFSEEPGTTVAVLVASGASGGAGAAAWEWGRPVRPK